MAGRVFLRGSTFYIAWYVRGKEYVRSTKQASQRIAERLLAQELRKGGTGHIPTDDNITFEDLVDKVRVRRELDRRRSNDLDQRVAHLEKFFQGMRAVDIGTVHIETYMQKRLKEGAAQATVNNELAVLRRGFNLVRLARKPEIKLPKPDNARQDFLDWGDFQRVREGLPRDMQDIATFLYLTSWRPGQVVALEWRDVDLLNRTVTARSETVKTGQAHCIPLVQGLWEIIERAYSRRRMDCPLVFYYVGRQGVRPWQLRGGTSPFRKAWRRACERAGFGNHVIYCMRRSGVRNMIGAGLDPMLAMKISGHKTMEMLSRYRIVDVKDRARGLEKMMAHLDEQPAESKVVPIKPVKKEGTND